MTINYDCWIKPPCPASSDISWSSSFGGVGEATVWEGCCFLYALLFVSSQAHLVGHYVIEDIGLDRLLV